MATMFRIDEEVDEAAMWDVVRRSGTVDVIYGNGIRETLIGPACWVSSDSFEDGDDVNECEFSFAAGYASGDGRHISSAVSIPSKALATMFAARLPAGMTIDWNAAEATHVVETRSPMTVHEAKAIIVPILEAHGFRFLP